MALDLQQIRLYARQIALPAVGSAGQERLATAQVVVFREARDQPRDLVDAAVAYLKAAGVGTVQVVPVPGDTPGWSAALAHAQVALRFALDDDALLTAAIAAGVPLILGRVAADVVDLLAFRHHGACAHHRPARPPAAAARAAEPGAAGTVLATLAAAECLWMLIDPERGPAARRLRLPLDGGAPVCDEIPWPPTCPLCAASGSPAASSAGH